MLYFKYIITVYVYSNKKYTKKKYKKYKYNAMINIRTNKIFYFLCKN